MNTDSGNLITNSDASASWTVIILRSLFITIIVYLITEIPYLVAYSKTPPGRMFVGQLAFLNDQNMYFSFIRQAANGHLLFINRLTFMPQHPVFINLEWLLVGKVMSMCGNSTQWAYQIWRFVGAFILVTGFSALAEIILTSRIQRFAAIIICTFGGGFGWFYSILVRLNLAPPNRWAILDLWTCGNPFAQIMLNPNHSLPLGIFCLMFVFYVKGERTDKTGPYLLAALMAVIDGLIRPYDVIAMSAIIPLYICSELVWSPVTSPRRIVLRLLPLLMVTPLILYYTYLFRFHQVFKFWGSQGRPASIPLRWHLLSLGVAGILCVLRLCMTKQYPLGKGGRLLLIWVISVLSLSHAYKLFDFMPYSFQLSTSLMPPVILLGTVLIGGGVSIRPKQFVITNVAVIFFLIALSSLSSPFMFRHFLDIISNNARASVRRGFEYYYIPIAKMESFDWLNRQGKEEDVVLSTPDEGNLLGKYTDKKIVIGHPAVTPASGMMAYHVGRFFKGDTPEDEAQRFLRYLDARWIYATGKDATYLNNQLQTSLGLTKCYDNQNVTIYATKINPLKCGSM
jgi:hypothetical protein